MSSARAQLRDEAKSEGAADKRCALWRKDLAFLTKFLPEKHPNLFHSIDESTWRAKAQAIDERLAAGTTLVDFVSSTTELVASVGDAHTNFAWHRAGFPLMALWFHEFADGIYVMRYPAKVARLRKAKLVAIEGLPVEDALARLDRFVSGTPIWRRRERLTIARCPAMWQAVGLGKGHELRLDLVDDKGERFEHVVSVGRPEDAPGPMKSSFDAAHEVWKRRRESFWYRFLPQQKVLHFYYGSCRDAKGFQKLVQKMRKELAGEELRAVVVDLRANGGGNSMVILPLYSYFVRRKMGGKVYCIVGRNTFSSAMMNADQMQKNFKAKLVGEDVGGKPGHFGEVRVVRLPESRLLLQYSTRDFGVDKRRDPLRVDIRVGAKAADVFAGKDPILDAVLAEVERAR